MSTDYWAAAPTDRKSRTAVRHHDAAVYIRNSIHASLLDCANHEALRAFEADSDFEQQRFRGVDEH